MNLPQLINSVRRRSNNSASRDDVIEAINEAARRVYIWVVKETPGKYFLKWDTSKSLLVGTQEYSLQSDFEQIARVRELDPGTGRWRVVHITDFQGISYLEGSFPTLYPAYLEEADDSPFKFFGPYEKNDGVSYIRFEPDIDLTRSLEIVYTAKFVEITDEKSYFMIPEEARGVVRDWAIAECLLDVDDDLSEKRMLSGQAKLTEYLTLLRAKQIQDTPRQEAYLDD